MFLRGILDWSSSSSFLTKNKDDVPSEKQSNFQYELTGKEKRQLRHSQEKPKVVALYDEHDGSANAELAIKHIEEKGIEVVKVSPKEGLNHPTMTQGDIHGIYLPGGSDIPVDAPHDSRKEFEGQLTQLASTKDIPLLGICRGEQALAYHNGLEVQDLTDFDKHYNHEGATKTNNSVLNNTVVVEPGSQLYAALRSKLKEKDSHRPLEYAVTCLHHQNTPGDSTKTNVTTSGRNKYDHSIESFEIKTGHYYSFGVQHHPEVTISSFEAERQEKISQAKKEAEDARFTSNYFDQDASLYTEYRSAQKIRSAHQKSRDELAARGEMRFFTNQVKKNFLEKIQKEEPENLSERDSDPYSLFGV